MQTAYSEVSDYCHSGKVLLTKKVKVIWESRSMFMLVLSVSEVYINLVLFDYGISLESVAACHHQNLEPTST